MIYGAVTAGFAAGRYEMKDMKIPPANRVNCTCHFNQSVHGFHIVVWAWTVNEKFMQFGLAQSGHSGVMLSVAKSKHPTRANRASQLANSRTN
jgi:hypothetical protein